MESNILFESLSSGVSRNVHLNVAGDAKHMHWFCVFPLIPWKLVVGSVSLFRVVMLDSKLPWIYNMHA